MLIRKTVTKTSVHIMNYTYFIWYSMRNYTRVWYETNHSRMDQVKYGSQPLKTLKKHDLLKADHTSSNFLKAVFHKIYLVHSWILYLKFCLWSIIVSPKEVYYESVSTIFMTWMLIPFLAGFFYITQKVYLNTGMVLVRHFQVILLVKHTQIIWIQVIFLVKHTQIIRKKWEHYRQFSLINSFN